MADRYKGAKENAFFSPLHYEVMPEERSNALRLQQDATKARPTSERDQLILKHHQLAYYVARQFTGRGVSYDDLVSEAMYGLCWAAEEFDPQRSSFSTYAVWVCRRVLHDMIRVHRCSTGASIGQQRLMPKLYRAINGLTAKYGRQPTIEELMYETSWPEEKVSQLLVASQRYVGSLDALFAPDEDDKHTAQDIIDRTAITPEQHLELKQQLHDIQRMRRDILADVNGRKWPDRWKEIFATRYRLQEQGVQLRTEKSVGRLLDISESRVSQVLAECWTSLRIKPISDVVTHRWFKALPHRVTMLADVFGVEAITEVFGPRELWEVHAKRKWGKDMAGRTAAGSEKLTTKEAELRERLLAIDNDAAKAVASVIEQLPILSERSRKIFAKRFGFEKGDLSPIRNAELATQMKLPTQTIGTSLFTGFVAMHKHGLSKRVMVRTLNPMIDVAQQLLDPSTPSAGKATKPASPKPVPVAKAVVSDTELRSRLKEYVASRQLEEEILRLWLVGTPDCFGPLEPADVAFKLGMETEAVEGIISRFTSFTKK